MAHVVKISNPLLSNDISLKRQFIVDLNVFHTKISKWDAHYLQPIQGKNQDLSITNKNKCIPLKIQLNENTAYISALITGDKTVFGSIAVDELCNRI